MCVCVCVCDTGCALPATLVPRPVTRSRPLRTLGGVTRYACVYVCCVGLSVGGGGGGAITRMNNAVPQPHTRRHTRFSFSPLSARAGTRAPSIASALPPSLPPLPSPNWLDAVQVFLVCPPPLLVCLSRCVLNVLVRAEAGHRRNSLRPPRPRRSNRPAAPTACVWVVGVEGNALFLRCRVVASVGVRPPISHEASAAAGESASCRVTAPNAAAPQAHKCAPSCVCVCVCMCHVLGETDGRSLNYPITHGSDFLVHPSPPPPSLVVARRALPAHTCGHSWAHALTPAFLAAAPHCTPPSTVGPSSRPTHHPLTTGGAALAYSLRVWGTAVSR